jgi:hypothetical protein
VLDAYPAILALSVAVHAICTSAGVAAVIVLTTCIPDILAATNFLELTPEGQLRNAEATLLDVIDNCKESISMLKLPEMTFLRGNESTLLYFGEHSLDAKILDIIYEDDRHVFLECVSELLEKEAADCADDGIAADATHILHESYCYTFGLSSSTSSLSSSSSSRDFTSEGLDSTNTSKVDEEAPLLELSRPTRSSSSSSNQSISVEFRVFDAQNELMWLESTILLRKESKNGELVTTMMLLTRNIHAKKSEEEILKREHAAKLQYITCCAHDLKTPLQSFSYALDLLLASQLNADQEDICKYAEVSLSLMNQTIAQTMDSNKILMVQTDSMLYLQSNISISITICD